MSLVFVYGSLKKGFHNDHYLRESKFISKAFTSHLHWEMISLGGFPAVILGKGIVLGELYEVNDRTLINLDRLEGEGHFYTKQLIPVTVPIGGSYNIAFMYILNTPPKYKDFTNVEIIPVEDASHYNWKHPIMG